MTEWRVEVYLDDVPQEGFVFARSEDEALMEFTAGMEGEISGDYCVDPIDEVLMSRLQAYLGTPDPWNSRFHMSMLEIDDPSNPDKLWECMGSLRANFSHDSPESKDVRTNSLWHAARILYVAGHEEILRDPIEMTSSGPSDLPEIIDGWHRYFAHLYLGREYIRVSYSGSMKLLDELTGVDG